MEVIIYMCVVFSMFCRMVYSIKFVEQPTGVTVVEGETFILRCVISDKRKHQLFWKTMDSSVLISNDTDVDPYNLFPEEKRGRYSIVGDHEAGEYNLKIINATRQDTGRYSCLFYTHFNHYSRIANVRIMIPPDAGYPKCSVHPHGAVVGDTVRLTCRSSGGDPPATLAWVSEKSILRMYMPQNPNPVIEVRHTLTEDDLNKVFSCAATTPALQQAVICKVVPLRKKIFVFVQPVVNRVMDGEYANFHCYSEKKSGTIRWVIGSNPVDLSDSRYTISRKGKRLRIHQTIRSEHDNTLVSCQVMDRFGVAGNASSLLVVNSWETTTPFMTTELSTEIIALDSNVGAVSPVLSISPHSANIRTTAVHSVTKVSPLMEKPGIWNSKNPGSTVTAPIMTKIPLVPTKTKVPLASTTREATTAQHSTQLSTGNVMTDSVNLNNTRSVQSNLNELATVSGETSRKQSSYGGTSVSPQSVQTMTTKQMYLTTESVQNTRLMRKSTVSFNTLSQASSNSQATRLMPSAISMEMKTDDQIQSTEKVIVHDMNDRTDISNEIVVTRGTQKTNVSPLDSNDIFTNKDESVKKNMTEISNDTSSHKAKKNNGDEASNELLEKSANVLIGGLVGLVVLIIIVIVLSIIYIKSRRETTEIKAV